MRDGTQQYGALPWRQTPMGVEILLLTSRETRRWVIPKGWPMRGCEGGECAAQEAFEEAGIEGRVSHAIGNYAYSKRLKDGSLRQLTVEVFPLEVAAELSDWPEVAERERRWFSPAEAANAVAEPELAGLIREFSAASVPPRT